MAVSRKTSKKCSRGKKLIKSHKLSSGKRVKAHCRKISRKRSMKVSRKRSMKVSRKRSRSPGRVKKTSANPCSYLKKSECSGDPNCHYVKKRGCLRRYNVASGKSRYEGPLTPSTSMTRQKYE
jgi:hypothetical protein